ncbi:CoA-binding protein [archaeon]|nr:MAG: CoA-binding protein [archaeon]
MRFTTAISSTLIIPTYSFSTRHIIVSSQRSKAGFLSSMKNKFSIADYFALPQFVVVGASVDREKFGNKVLRAYKEKGYKATPINTRADVIEDLPTAVSLTAFAAKLGGEVGQVGVSIITPPAVTKSIMQEGLALGYKYYFLQPGTADASVQELIDSWHREKKAHVIQDCVLVQLDVEH